MITLACALVACVIVGRLYMLQILDGGMYEARAEAQASPVQEPLLDRNNIYFTDKDGQTIVAATMQEGTSTVSAQAGAPKRFYPGGSLAAQEIGFVAYNGDNTQKGRYGLERYYDQTLTQASDDLYTNFSSSCSARRNRCSRASRRPEAS